MSFTNRAGLILSFLSCVIFFVGCTGSKFDQNNSNKEAAENYFSEMGGRQIPNSANTNNPLIKNRLAKIEETLQKPIPILTLIENFDENQQTAQTVAITDTRFQADLRDKENKIAQLNEIFGVYPLRESDFFGATQSCRTGKCYRVEMYNFALNQMTNAVVEVDQKTVLSVNKSPLTQPDIPVYLKDLAVSIATTAPEVLTQLGFQPNETQVLMANTKTALNKSRCERSKHLCVAPTFTKDGRALWAITDLTDLNLVGVRWTNTGTIGQAVTEKKLQNDVLVKEFCEHTNRLEKNGWARDYILTSSDGLRISNLTFNGKAVAHDVKLVDWHVSYSGTDGFGYSDAVGCPVFSQSAVIAVEPPKIESLMKNGKEVGVSLTQDYWSEGYPTACNYYYSQKFEFYNDGRFRPAIAAFGRGCGDDGTYRPVTRIAFAAENFSFAEWQTGAWQTWQTERWQEQKPDTAFTPEGFQFRFLTAENSGFYIEPARGQFGDGGRGDNAFVYVTKHQPDKDEGDSDLTTIGPCCNTDYRQGPEKFIEPAPDPIENTSLVLWYVAQLKNDDDKGKEYCWSELFLENGVYRAKQFPCWSGPMMHPF